VEFSGERLVRTEATASETFAPRPSATATTMLCASAEYAEVEFSVIAAAIETGSVASAPTT
jgi:hypothetical protein